MNKPLSTRRTKCPIAILITAVLAGCNSVPVEDAVPKYGVEQISMDGMGQYVLCNPCRMPTPKVPDTKNDKVSMRYGDSISGGLQSAMSALSQMAMSTISRNQLASEPQQGPITLTSNVPETPASAHIAASAGYGTSVVSGVTAGMVQEDADDVYKMVTLQQNSTKIPKTDTTLTSSAAEPKSDTLRNDGVSTTVQNAAPNDARQDNNHKSTDEADAGKTDRIDRAQPTVDVGPRAVQIETANSMAPYKSETLADPTNKYTVNFSSNSSDLDEKALDRLIEVLRNAPEGTRIVIVGYSDSVGGLAVNDRIAQSRSRSVRDWLSERGVSADRVEADPSASKGLCCYISDNTTVEGRAANRRVEITFVHSAEAETTAGTPALTPATRPSNASRTEDIHQSLKMHNNNADSEEPKT